MGVTYIGCLSDLDISKYPFNKPSNSVMRIAATNNINILLKDLCKGVYLKFIRFLKYKSSSNYKYLILSVD